MNEWGITEWLLSILSMAFAGWSTLLWSALVTVRRAAAELRNTLIRITSDLTHLERDFNNHFAKPWHEEAGNKLTSLEERLSSLERKQ